ncbi:hypothetical protein CJQ79_003648 [Salmonella enterica subsp. enterica serovar Saintpaul]|nr:hypothetical protein [Salmonella enterica subsp. enterica serovar Saintpaul]
MKLVQLVLLCSCLVAGGVRAALVEHNQSESLSSTAITLDNAWLDGVTSSGSAQVHTWKFSDENQHDGCGFLCVDINASAFRAAYMTGQVSINSVGEQTVSPTELNGKAVKLKATLSDDVMAHGVIYVRGAKNAEQNLTGLSGDGATMKTGNVSECYLYVGGCDFRFLAGISGGSVTLSMSVPDLLQAKSFTIPPTTIAKLVAEFYSIDVGEGIVGNDKFRYTVYIQTPALTVTFPDRCYTSLSGNTVTFKNDIDASAVTGTGSPAIDTKSITLNARCDASFLSKNVYASVKLVQVNGVEDNYKFKLIPKKNDYGSSRTLSVVAKHITSGSQGGRTCDKDGNTMVNNEFYHVGLVSFNQSHGSLNDPYPITFNLCAFRPEGSDELLPPGEHTGAVRVVTRFYSANN